MTLLLALGTRKGLFLARRDGDGTAWWAVEGPQFLMREIAAVGVVPGPEEAPRLLVGVHSEHWGPTVMRSDDLGASWQETEHGSIRFPEDTGAALARVWQLQADAVHPEVVWAGCEPTSLWRSGDHGESFELVRGLWDHPHRPQWQPGAGGAAVHTVIGDPDDDTRLLVAMSTGGVYVSGDAGASWAPSNSGISANFLPDPSPEFGQCVHKVAVDAGGRDRLYAQNHPGVYRSDDAGATWTSIADGLPSDFGFSVMTHPRQPGVAWVIPLEADERRVPIGGRLRLHRTSDAGATWTEVGKGLPDGDWATVLRDAACALDGGEGRPAFLAVGTRDGCVFTSDDDGDTFFEVASHLPDVLCVRALRLP